MTSETFGDTNNGQGSTFGAFRGFDEQTGSGLLTRAGGHVNGGRARVPGQVGHSSEYAQRAAAAVVGAEAPEENAVSTDAAAPPAVDMGAFDLARQMGDGAVSVADHPLLQGLLSELPPKGTPLPAGWLDRWFDAARSIMELLYATERKAGH